MKILIVDDSLATLEIVRRGLEKFGYRKLHIQKADRARKALQIIGQWKPDIVLTDWNMPDMSGIQLLNAIMQRRLDMKVAMITTVDDQDQIELALQAGAAFVLSKPFDDETLHNHILPLVQGVESSELLLNNVEIAIDSDLALPKLNQLEKLIHKHIDENLVIQTIKPQLFDETKVPCVMAVYEDPENQKVRAVGVLDIYATCVMASSCRVIPVEEAQQAIHQYIVSPEILEAAKDALTHTAYAFLDKRTRKSLRVKTIKFVPATFSKLEQLFKTEVTRRLDFSCQREGMALGKILLVGL
ncbi:response regulator [Pseudoalteromonas xiamenensis]|uniref:Response regulator n=1 Tax=Pseudoalteromonas xiamenensis TaxID=882626 RepID=A0A975DHX3_9GAMM|nr:response regulator [Pseudoalteromonas xiamenensis]QTH72000.1 response regulator [Pseudoalteromonas xiamenensis]